MHPVKLCALVAAMLGLLAAGVTASAALADEPPAAPTKVDRCGGDQDEYVIPESERYAYKAYDRVLEPGTHQLWVDTAIHITAIHRASGGSTGWSWTLRYTRLACPSEAANVYTAQVGRCHHPQDAMTTVTVSVHNVADPTDRWIAGVEVSQYRLMDNHRGPADRILIQRVRDGETGSAAIASRSATGLLPGTWVIDFRIHGALAARRQVFVPPCGGQHPVKGDPGVIVQSPGSAHPRGRLTVRKGKRLRAMVDNRGVQYTTRARVVGVRKGRVVYRSQFRTGAGNRHRFTSKVQGGVRYRLTLRVRTADNRWRWRVVSRTGVR